MITEETKIRLFHRRRTSETIDDMINRLLDETIVEMTVEEMIETASENYDDISAITVNHQELPDSGLLYVKIWSPEIMVGGEANVFTPSHRVVIERENETARMQPVVVEDMYSPNVTDDQDTTPVYIEDLESNALIELAEGIENLKNKLQKPEDWESGSESETIESFHDT